MLQELGWFYQVKLEPAMCVVVVSKLTTSKTLLDEMTVDNDSTTMAHV
jgi:hypothetical protein